MSHRSQFLPASSYAANFFPESLAELNSLDQDLYKAQVLREWLINYPVMDAGLIPSLNWNAVLGIGLATAVSASIWAGVALALAQIWR